MSVFNIPGPWTPESERRRSLNRRGRGQRTASHDFEKTYAPPTAQRGCQLLQSIHGGQAPLPAHPIGIQTLEEDKRYLVNVTGHRELAPAHVHITRKNSIPRSKEVLDFKAGEERHPQTHPKKIIPRLMKVDRVYLMIRTQSKLTTNENNKT
ncbi:hypothetical protein SK128_003252 [Halocaridina rubra]|uniref:Uncharacterized protein n=1 Tax=Halocaridina rubra TaxID=373956 RepID=A0AAN9AAL2_HALRR